MALCTLVGKVRSKLSIPRPIILGICLIFLIAIFSILFITLVPPFTQEFQQLIVQLPTAARKLWIICIGLIDYFSNIIYSENSKPLWDQEVFLNGFIPLPDGVSLANGVGDGIKKILGLAGDLGIGLAKILFVSAIGIMIASQPVAYREIAIILIPSFYRKRARIILLKCGEALSDWMLGVLISSLFVAFIAGIGLSILGVKLVIANAILAGLLNVIPNVGPAISTIFPFSVAIIDDPWKGIAVILLYIVIQNLESYLITPSIMHHQVKLLPGLTLIAQFSFTILFGPIGLILALPLTVILQVIIREVLVIDVLNQWKNKRLAR